MALRSIALLLTIAAALSAQNVRITWIGQACFYIQTENGPTVVVDPPAANIGYTLPATPADVVTISHNHGDHNNAAGVRGTPTLVDGRPTTERTDMSTAGMPFVLVPGFHDNTNGAARGRNTIIKWTQAGLRFAHFGDYGQDALTEAQLADLRDLDVMMVPAGGFFTVEGPGIARLIEQLRPRVAILMHFRTAIAGPAQLANHPAVVGPFPAIRYRPASLTLSRATLPATNEVWVMEPVLDAAVVPAAGFTSGAPAAPSAIMSMFGNFSGSATTQFGGFPLPRKLGETEVFLGNEALPLFYVSPGQINFQVRGTQAAGQEILEVRVGGQRVARGVLTTVAQSPGVFVAVDQEGRLNRVRRGQSLTIYGSGQGSVSPQVADGAAAPATPLAATPGVPGVMLGTVAARVIFSGLTPGYAGLWQINIQVAPETPPGEVELRVWYEPNLQSNVVKVVVE